MAVFGICCLIYYIMLRCATKKWNSTFAVFWLILGMVCLCVRVALTVYPHLAEWMPYKLMFGALLVFIAAECLVLSGAIPSGEKNPAYIIVLGAQIQGTKITDSLMRRLERARRYLMENPDTKVIVSGGQGRGEDMTEAEVMAEFLASKGIKRERIILENRSRTTKENLEFSAAYIENRSEPVGIVSNNFHMFRALCYARRLGYADARKIPAGCHALLFVNYMVREFFAVIKFLITF